MNLAHIEIALLSMLVAVSCVLPGIFLVLRGVALMSDAISHSIVLGIVCMFFVVHSLSSPWLLLGAALAGVLTVVATELLIKQRHMKEDAAIGLVFPFLFSLGIILMSVYARNVHLDVDMVMLGEIAFAPFNRLNILGYDCGPYALWVVGVIVALQVILLRLCYKELVLVLFDKEYATVNGISSHMMYYGLMLVTSITAVGAFDSVGSVVTVALMITPAATAFLLTHKLDSMIQISLVCGMSAALIGYISAYMSDVSIAGAIAVVTGLQFIAAFVYKIMYDRRIAF
jgi:manganese/zinc/iron transport system permease protein